MRYLAIVLLLTLGSIQAHSQVTRKIDVILRSNIGIDTMWDGTPLRVFGMPWTLMGDPDIPSPTIYCNERDSVILHARSISQNDHHTIHLHGLDVDTRNDGDPATSFSLSHMQDTTYTFVARHAGTYIYHCHMADVVHVQMGMYGLIVVRAADDSLRAWTGGPRFDKSYEWLTSEIDSAWHNNIPIVDIKSDTVNIPVYRPSYFLINGKSESQLTGKRLIGIAGGVDQSLYVRIANIGFCKNRIIFPSSLRAKVLDSDGRPLEEAILTDTVEVYPGERYGVMLQPIEKFSGSVQVQYLSLNTRQIWNTQYITANVSTSSVKAELERSQVLYPNPASGSVHAPIAGKYSITDLLGNVLAIGKTEGEIKVDRLNTGSYVLVINGTRWKFSILR